MTNPTILAVANDTNTDPHELCELISRLRDAGRLASVFWVAITPEHDLTDADVPVILMALLRQRVLSDAPGWYEQDDPHYAIAGCVVAGVPISLTANVTP